MDLSTSCRICLSKETNIDMKPVTNSYFENMSYEELINFCTGINLADDTQMYPNSICCTCEEHLLQCNRFKKQLIESTRQLEEMFVLNSKKNAEIEIVIVESLDFDEIEKNQNLEINIDLTQDSHSESSSSDFFSDNIKNSTIENTSQRSKHKTKELNFCHRCQTSFCSIDEFELHRKTYHSRHKVNLCLFCGILTKNRFHEETHKDASEKKLFNCSVCNKTYTLQGGLNYHMRTHTHPHELRYDCQYCEKKFYSCNTRYYHTMRDHGLKPKFSCNICGKDFIRGHAYKMHMFSHTGERPHKCELCEMGFKTAPQLQNHMIVHTKERNHKCETCQKKFAGRRSLRNHMKIHTGEKNYICPVCSEAFLQNVLLRTHVTKKHPNYDLPPRGTTLSQKAMKRELKNKCNVQNM